MAGRPSTFTEEIAARICAEIAEGKSVRKVCEANDMPAVSTVFLWIAKHPAFSEQYARAQSDRTTFWSEEIVEIADDDAEDVQRARLRIDTRKWLMSKMAPKKYGDKIAIGGDRTMDPITTIDLTKATDEQLAALENIFGPLASGAGEDDAGDTAGEGEAQD